MYKNRISRMTLNRNPNSQPQFFICLSDIAFDDRVAYVESVCATLVESVCATLVESRFGPGSIFEASPVVINLSDRPELEPAHLYDLCDDGPNGLVPGYAHSPLGRAGYQVVEPAYRRAKQMGILDAGPNARNSIATLTPNQGRGSP